MIDVTPHLSLAKWIAGRVLRKWPKTPIDDMLGQAYLLLVDAATRFDPDRGVQFNTYATHRIYGRLREWARREWHLAKQHREVEITENVDVIADHDEWDLRVDLNQAIDAAGLTARQREGLAMVIIDGLSAAESGRAIGVTRHAGQQMYESALTKVRESYRTLTEDNHEVDEGQPGRGDVIGPKRVRRRRQPKPKDHSCVGKNR